MYTVEEQSVTDREGEEQSVTDRHLATCCARQVEQNGQPHQRRRVLARERHT